MTSNKKRYKLNKNKLSFVMAMVAVLVGLFIILPLLFDGENNSNLQPSAPATEVVEEAIELKISCVGDVMVHKPQLSAQYNNIVEGYSFENNFEYVYQYIDSADLALCNLETTFAGGKYSGYPLFNAPESLAGALKNAGFDVAITSNNHIMDMGLEGMKRTLQVSREAGLKTTGTQLEGEKNYIVVDVKNVKIGVVAFTFETPNVNGRTTINGNYVSDEALPLLNTFNYETMDDDLIRIQNAITDAREDGAELIVCYFHWGEEYQRSPNEYQQYIARQAAAYSADIIFASHPHVLQGMEMLTDELTGKKVPIYYSMGNFISNQRAETLNNRYTEQGMIAEVNLEYIKSTKQILEIEMIAIPTWVEKYKSEGKDIYSIIPLDKNLDQNPTLAVSGHLSRAQQALTDIKELLGEEYVMAN